MPTKQSIEQEVVRLGRIQPWWHDIELPHGVRTIGERAEHRPNHNEVKWERLKDWVKLRDAAVIDLGCNEGVFCQAAHRAGAARVVGVDINEHRIEKARFVAEVSGTTSIDFVRASVYALDADALGGRFDLALVLGLLHRVPDPYGLVLKVGELADAAVFEWRALDSDQPLMEFWGGDYKESDRDNTGYWRVSRACLRAILRRTPFTVFADLQPTGRRAVMATATTSGSRFLTCSWRPLAGSDAAGPDTSWRRWLARWT